jgi:hypothetical protein
VKFGSTAAITERLSVSVLRGFPRLASTCSAGPAGSRLGCASFWRVLVSELCQLGYCDRDAVVAVHVLSDSSVLFRTDHLTEPFISDWRCLDCAVEALEGFGGVSHEH